MAEPTGAGQGVIAKRYTSLASLREPFLRRARACSSLTKPTLIPPEGHTGQTEYPVPYQTVGCEGVSSFSTHLNTILFPVGTSWFRYRLKDDTVQEGIDSGQAAPDTMTKIEKRLSEREEKIREYSETINLRATTSEVGDHITVGGNSLFYVPQEDKPLRCYGMDRYVTRRTPGGEALEHIIEEEVLVSTLSKELRAHCFVNVEESDTAKTKIYTQIVFDQDRNKWLVKQEIAGTLLPEEGVGEKKEGAWGEYPKDYCPYVPVRWSQIDGEAWGRGYVEGLLGGIISLDVLERSIVEGAQIAALSLIGVKPGGATKKSALEKAKNGDILSANFTAGSGDVSMLRADKNADFSVAMQRAEKLEESLRRAFLMHGSVQRKGERVTAFEIQAMIQALDEQAGGSSYSILATEFQAPVIKLIIRRMEKLGKIEALPDDLVDTVVITGLEALGRNKDLQKLMQFAQVTTQLYGPQALAQYTKPEVALAQVATSLGYNDKGFIKTSDEIAEDKAAAAQAAQQQMMAQHLAAPAAQVLTKGMELNNAQDE